ncbi:MAG: hypothetical protein IJB97_01925, partial [Clostridia bacterium]|nr:hypothetical protein [Clostridia bacterium]
MIFKLFRYALGVIRRALYVRSPEYPKRGKRYVAVYRPSSRRIHPFAVFVFLAVFYGTFGPIAVLKPYAFDKIAVYFGALEVVGRVDLLLVY